MKGISNSERIIDFTYDDYYIILKKKTFVEKLSSYFKMVSKSKLTFSVVYLFFFCVTSGVISIVYVFYTYINNTNPETIVLFVIIGSIIPTFLFSFYDYHKNKSKYSESYIISDKSDKIIKLKGYENWNYDSTCLPVKVELEEIEKQDFSSKEIVVVLLPDNMGELEIVGSLKRK